MANLHPQWNQSFDIVGSPDDTIDLILYDWSHSGSDEELAKTSIPFNRIIQEPTIDEWIVMNITLKKGLLQKNCIAYRSSSL